MSRRMIVTLVDGGQYTIEGNFEFEIEELRDYVQVEFVTKIKGAPDILYTYIDPGLELGIGDLVEVPTKYSASNLAIVRALGPQDEALADLIVKEVTALYERVVPEAPPSDYSVR